MVIDTKGRSGTFDYSRAEDLTNDKIICQQLVKDNVNLVFDYTRFAFTKYVEIGTIGLIKSDELQSKKIYRNCLKGEITMSLIKDTNDLQKIIAVKSKKLSNKF